MPRILIAVAALTIALAAGCSTAAAPQLAGREFVSVAVTDGGAPRPLVAGSVIRLSFSATDLGASAGCNHIGGTYRIDGGILIFEGGSMTEMACDPERDAQDQWLSQLLASRPAIRLAGNDLALESGSVRVSLRDREVVEPDANLVGPTWTVESIISGDAVASVPAEATATIVFKADGTFDLNAGCNSGGGNWRSVADGMEVSNILLTRMACGGAAGALESAVLAVLDAGTIAAGIDSTVLTLQAGTNGLQLRAG